MTKKQRMGNHEGNEERVMRKTGEVLAVYFLLRHWKSEPWGWTLFDFVVAV